MVTAASVQKKADCQRFFGYGKKIPKDVKRHCGMCRQHGIVVETRGHLCQFKNCDCSKCKLVRQRRSIMSTQIRIRREQDKKFQRTTDASEADVVPWDGEEKKEEINMCYFCQKCKNHGLLMWKKDHKKNCEYSNCRCDQCDLIDTRRALDRHIKSSREEASTSSASEMSSSSSPGEEKPRSFASSASSLNSSSTENLSPAYPSPNSKTLFEFSSPLTPTLFPFAPSIFPQFLPYSPFYPIVPPFTPSLNPLELQVMLNALCSNNF